MEEFRRALLHCGLIDLGFTRNIFTWRNGRPVNAFVQERLDQACANTEWREIYPHARVHHLQAAYSDHKPILNTTQVVTQVSRRRRKPKKFEERWASDPTCKGVIRGAWERVNHMNLFTTSNKTNLESVMDSVDKVVTLDMNHTLLQPYTPEEVRKALFSMHPSKSPELDGADGKGLDFWKHEAMGQREDFRPLCIQDTDGDYGYSIATGYGLGCPNMEGDQIRILLGEIRLPGSYQEEGHHSD
ncbi:hypothetical protein SO802_014146 [Lithocarpus litseifolius]|uniref:Endonuclease/exonuclease/phosphatase domain-containing protein n=1 Tax=Lithocarpus litseifolius TaxID=425828 RepID=A0AAW2CT50_9ROSI